MTTTKSLSSIVSWYPRNDRLLISRIWTTHLSDSSVSISNQDLRDRLSCRREQRIPSRAHFPAPRPKSGRSVCTSQEHFEQVDDDDGKSLVPAAALVYSPTARARTPFRSLLFRPSPSSFAYIPRSPFREMQS
jgi:hypothetical protein